MKCVVSSVWINSSTMWLRERMPLYCTKWDNCHFFSKLERPFSLSYNTNYCNKYAAVNEDSKFEHNPWNIIEVYSEKRAMLQVVTYLTSIPRTNTLLPSLQMALKGWNETLHILNKTLFSLPWNSASTKRFIVRTVSKVYLLSTCYTGVTMFLH